MPSNVESIRRIRKILRDEACLPVQYRNQNFAPWFGAYAPAGFDPHTGLWRLPSIGASLVSRPARFYQRAEKMFVDTPEALAWRAEQAKSFDMSVWREMWRRSNSSVA